MKPCDCITEEQIDGLKTVVIAWNSDSLTVKLKSVEIEFGDVLVNITHCRFRPLAEAYMKYQDHLN